MRASDESPLSANLKPTTTQSDLQCGKLCDVLQCCQAFEPTFERAKVVGLDALNPPSFYARMAANSLPVEELATFALYVGAGLGGKGILVATERYELFRRMPLTWVSDYVPNSELL